MADMTDTERMARAIWKKLHARQWPENTSCVEKGQQRECYELATAAKAALAAAGLVIVPRPATMAMRDAGLKAWRSSRDKHEEQLLMDVFEAMIAAHTEKAGE